MAVAWARRAAGFLTTVAGASAFMVAPRDAPLVGALVAAAKTATTARPRVRSTAAKAEMPATAVKKPAARRAGAIAE